MNSPHTNCWQHVLWIISDKAMVTPLLERNVSGWTFRFFQSEHQQ